MGAGAAVGVAFGQTTKTSDRVGRTGRVSEVWQPRELSKGARPGNAAVRAELG